MEDFKGAFKHFNHSGDGSVSAAQMRHILTSYGEKLKPEEVRVQPLCGRPFTNRSNPSFNGSLSLSPIV
jgi:hypothetical protein